MPATQDPRPQVLGFLVTGPNGLLVRRPTVPGAVEESEGVEGNALLWEERVEFDGTHRFRLLCINSLHHA